MKITDLQTYEKPKYIGEGRDGIVYRISDDKAAKTPHPPGVFKRVFKTIGHESLIAQRLYDDIFPVPKPYGLHMVNFDFATQEAFVMEYIQGQVLAELNHTKVGRDAYQLFIDIIKKIKQKGYTPLDAYPENVIVKENGLIVLIDFADWKHPEILYPQSLDRVI